MFQMFAMFVMLHKVHNIVLHSIYKDLLYIGYAPVYMVPYPWVKISFKE